MRVVLWYLLAACASVSKGVAVVEGSSSSNKGGYDVSGPFTRRRSNAGAAIAASRGLEEREAEGVRGGGSRGKAESIYARRTFELRASSSQIDQLEPQIPTPHSMQSAFEIEKEPGEILPEGSRRAGRANKVRFCSSSSLATRRSVPS